MRAGFIGIIGVVRNLAEVIILDAFGRDIQGRQRLLAALGAGACNVLRREAQGLRRQIHPVEALGIGDQGRIAMRAHLGNDGAHDLRNIFPGLALLR